MFFDRLSPPAEPHASGFLPPCDGHRVYWESCGNPDGQPILWLHGGPGSGISPRQRQQFDPAIWQAFLIDQRGCGRSTHEGGAIAATASANLANTTDDLIADLERLREAAGIRCWTVCGGSWGATLALAYAARYPKRVSAMVLRSAFLAGEEEILALFDEPSTNMPQQARHAWNKLMDASPELAELAPAARLEYMHDWLFRTEEAQSLQTLKLAWAWTGNEWARSLIGGQESDEPWPAFAQAPQQELARTLQRARVQIHYLRGRCFIDMNAVLHELKGWARANPSRFALVHGECDGLCPPGNARRIAFALGMDESAIRFVPGVGHQAFAPGMIAAWNAALEQVLKKHGEAGA